MNTQTLFRLPSAIFLGLFLTLSACQDDDVCTSLEPVEVDLSGDIRSYIVSSIQIPNRGNQARELAVDLDGDGLSDNSLGSVLAILQQYSDYDLGAEASALIDTGELLQLIQIQSTSLTSAQGVGVQIALGLDLDDDPSDNHSGSEFFAIDPRVQPGHISGSLTEGTLQAELGSAPIAVTFPGLEEVFILHLSAVQIEATVSEEGLEGTIAGVLSVEEVQQALLPAVFEGFQRAIASDCPAGQCTEESFGQTLLSLMDANSDGTLTQQELKDSLIFETVTNPDLDLYVEGNDLLTPSCDGQAESLSVVIGFTATRAATT